MAGKFQFTAKLDEWVDRCFRALTQGDEKFEKEFLLDTKWHDDAAKRLKEKIFNRIAELKPEELKKLIGDKDKKDKNERAMMQRYVNLKAIFDVIDNDFNKVIDYLRFIKNFKGAPKDLDRLVNTKRCLHIKGAGLFFITQLLAGAHLDKYVVYHDKLYEVLQNSGMLDRQGINCLKSKKGVIHRYLCVNEICKQMYREKFEERMKASYKFGLQSVHNFLWHYDYYKHKDCWWDKDC